MSPSEPDRAPLQLSQRWQWASQQAISFLMQQGVENPGVLSLAARLVDPQTLPGEEVRAAINDILGHAGKARHALQYGTTQGADLLRNEMRRHLLALEGHSDEAERNLDTKRMVLTTGSQQLLSLTAEILFDPGDICLVAAPTYFVFLGNLNGVGARTISIPVDDEGMIVSEAETMLQRLAAEGELHRVKLIYAVSYYENPSGLSLSTARRQELAELVRRWAPRQRIYILEDAAYRELRYDGPEYPSIWSFAPECTILAQTFSKTFSPGLRVGYGVLPLELVGPICDRKGNEDFGSAHLNQLVLAHVLKHGLYAKHVREVQDAYRLKRNAMLAAADKFMTGLPGVSWVHPHGGLYVWLSVPPTMDASFSGALFRQAVKVEQVMYVPGDLCFTGPTETRPRNHLRLSFGVLDAEKITLSMERLAAAIRAVGSSGT